MLNFIFLHFTRKQEKDDKSAKICVIMEKAIVHRESLIQSALSFRVVLQDANGGVHAVFSVIAMRVLRLWIYLIQVYC